ncbi:MAG: hypothetical protein CM1200mP9_11020 [Gammaproteobacteria bacterium]|nr:MAG: hypothetical protein CM1200mP9_11020 [Gammaproteobacteria bacterium]
MLVGDEGASNVDPYATGPTDDNEWIDEGPHLMIVVPDASLLEGIPTDPVARRPLRHVERLALPAHHGACRTQVVVTR